MRLNFLLTLIFIDLVIHAYIGLRLIPDLALNPTQTTYCWLSLVASGLLTPLAMLTRLVHVPILSPLMAWTGYLWMGLLSCLLVLTLIRDVLLLPYWLLKALGDAPAGSAWVIPVSAALVPVGAFLATLLGLYNARRLAGVVDVSVPIADLPAGLEGFTIVQISDIHVGTTIRRGYLQAIVDAVNGLQPHMIAITGDLVDGSVDELSAHVAPLASLRAQHGVFCVTGNHEYYSDAKAWVAAFRKLGLRVLMNEGHLIVHGQSSVFVAGVTDFNAHHFYPEQRSDPAAAIAQAPGDSGFKLLLAHQPRSAISAAMAGFQLQLSGHTHGGQFLPWNFLVPLQQPFTAGLRRLQDLWVYTSRGTGYWGPPMRLGAPSEITRLRLTRA